MPFQLHIPPVNQLSVNQQQALSLSLEDNECLLITGCPGSGKTTVANFRAAQLERELRRFRYIIYARVLHAYVRQSFSDPALNIAEDRVSTFAKWFYNTYRERNVMTNARDVDLDVLVPNFSRLGRLYNEMIVDEAQDLDPELIRHLPLVTSAITICADDAQNVFDEGDGFPNTTFAMRTALEAQGVNVHPVHLGFNYRNPPEIYAFAKAFVPNNPTIVTRFVKASGQKPALLQCSNIEIMMTTIENIITNRGQENIGILCDTTGQINEVSRTLQSRGIDHTAFHYRMAKERIRNELQSLKNVVVCTNKSAKGLEFQTVIIPFAEDLQTGESYKRAYYVACTRAERTLFLVTSRTNGNMAILSQISPDLYEKI